jgi:hypothetical protein
MQEETKGDDARLASCVDGETGERCPESGGGGLAPGGKQIRDRVYLPHQIELPNALVFLKKKKCPRILTWGEIATGGPAQGKLWEPPADWASQRSS